MEAVFFRQPNGTNGFLTPGSWIKQGETFSATVPIPASALGGEWRITEFGVKTPQDVTYRFMASDLHPAGTACPAFQNIGVFTCASSIVRDSGKLTIQGQPVGPEPQLQALSFSPTPVAAGTSTTLSFAVTNADSVEAVFFRQPNGTNGFLAPESWKKTGDTFSATVPIPVSALGGEWRITELGVRTLQDVVYRFSAADIYPSQSACPVFQNIGVFTCASSIVRDSGRVTVQGDAAGPDPHLQSLEFSPNPVLAGGSTTLSFSVTNADTVEAVFFRQPNATFSPLTPGGWSRTGDTFSATVEIPPSAMGGEWRITELGVQTAQDVTYRFAAADLSPGETLCPTFQNIGVFSCASAIVRDSGRLVVQD
ncbi:hypothetical protein AYO38_05960 [bacterium SCGC AG-212-C10]|nr:hypothetical protein AYO38_05960 [bacterium SCGC AG-212-C10]